MNQNRSKILQRLNFSGIGSWLTWLALAWLLGTIGLGWLVKSFLIFIGLMLLAPVIALVGFGWWLKRNLVEARCPVCSFEFTGFNRSQFPCPSCGEPLQAESGDFHRLTPPGTIDVEAVEVSAEVSARQLED